MTINHVVITDQPVYINVWLSVLRCRFNPNNFFVTVSQQPPVGQGLLSVEDTQSNSDTPQSVELLWTSDQPVTQNSDNTQHSQETNIYAPGGIRTSNPSKRAAADPSLLNRAATGIG